MESEPQIFFFKICFCYFVYNWLGLVKARSDSQGRSFKNWRQGRVVEGLFVGNEMQWLKLKSLTNRVILNTLWLFYNSLLLGIWHGYCKRECLYRKAGTLITMHCYDFKEMSATHIGHSINSTL